MKTVKIHDPDKQVTHTEEGTVKGTMFSVAMVGAVIFITYLVIYGLYMVRV